MASVTRPDGFVKFRIQLPGACSSTGPADVHDNGNGSQGFGESSDSSGFLSDEPVPESKADVFVTGLVPAHADLDDHEIRTFYRLHKVPGGLKG